MQDIRDLTKHNLMALALVVKVKRSRACRGWASGGSMALMLLAASYGLGNNCWGDGGCIDMLTGCWQALMRLFVSDMNCCQIRVGG